MTTQNVLKGKRILFLSVKTFNYENEIALQLRNLGAIVDYYDERPANSIFVKGIIRSKRNWYQVQIDKYYKYILKRIDGNHYDFLFVIKGEVIPKFFLESFKHKNSNCKSIFYIWDSFANSSHSLSILPYFDECFTFDPVDAQKFKINFRPLFYIEKYGNLNKRTFNKYDFDLLFIGTAHSDRYIISNKIISWCKKNGLNSFAYYFMPSKLVFVYKKFFDKSFKQIDYSKISFASLQTDSILDLYTRSSIILDINHPNQSGLTMRTFEALGAGKKLITTNSNIKKYPFFNENNICVIDRKMINMKNEFFNTPFISIEPQLLFDMSITGWINEIFCAKTSNYWIKNTN